MPIEWIAISAAVIPHIKKYAASRADRLADGLLARTYRRLVPDEKLVRANETFVSRFSKELDSAIDLATLNAEPYQLALQQFLESPTVQEVIQAPLDGQSELDWCLLRGIWDESHYIQLPADFDWSRLAKTYRQSVMNQMLTDPALRPIVATIASMRSADLAESAAASLERLTGPQTSFDLDRYAQAVKTTCAHLNMGPLDSDWPQYERSIRLNSVYVPQAVKQALPPRDITRDYLRSLRERRTTRGVELDDDRLTRLKQEYAQMESRNVIDVVDEPSYDRLVILGDPGLGKSTLLKLLALRWIGERTRPLVLFVELRRAGADSGHRTFLDYLQDGNRPFCCLPRVETHKHLKDNDSLILFDGLDEVPEPHRTDVVSEIIRFGGDYPRARIVVTTRIYGYFPGSTHPDEFRDARFQQFTLQDFGDPEIDRFVTRWHQEAFPEATARALYESRLRNAIADSPAIHELAANPLLLTMMAVLSRTQDLPRDRGKLYEMCAELLLKNWDLDKFPELKGRKEPRDIRDKLGPGQKMRILDQVAAAMQSERTGIEGNLIAEERLNAIVQQELRILEVPQSWSVAEDLIWMLRERNFMLAHLGDRQYAFVHRTFLEYFCARDLKFRLEKTRNFKEDDLYDVFEQHWQEEAWHEVLRLLCGIIGVEYADGCISEILRHATEPDGHRAVFLAAQCLNEVRELGQSRGVRAQVRAALTALVEFDLPYYYDEWEGTDDLDLVRGIRADAIHALTRGWSGEPDVFAFLIRIARSTPLENTLDNAGQDLGQGAREAAVIELSRGFKGNPGTLEVFEDCAALDVSPDVRATAISEIARGWGDKPDTLQWLWKNTTNEYWRAREATVKAIASEWRNAPETLERMRNTAADHDDGIVRATALNGLIAYWGDDPNTLRTVEYQLARDSHPSVRIAALQGLARRWKNEPGTLSTLMNCAMNDPSVRARSAAASELAQGWRGDPVVFALLQEIAASNPDSETRVAAVQAVGQARTDGSHLIEWLKARATEDTEPSIRWAALAELVLAWKEKEVVSWFEERATVDTDEDVRCGLIGELAGLRNRYPEVLVWLKSRLGHAQEVDGKEIVKEIARGWKNGNDTLPWLRAMATKHHYGGVRAQAVEELGRGWHNNSEVINCLADLAFRDGESAVRSSAVRAVARARRGNPDIQSFLRDRATHDDQGMVRDAALQEFVRISDDGSDLREFLTERVTSDELGTVRHRALTGLIIRWPDEDEVIALVKDRIGDEDPDVRKAVVEALANLEEEDPSIIDLLKARATTDDDREVRQQALWALGICGAKNDDVLVLMKHAAMTDPDVETRLGALWGLVGNWKNDHEVLHILRDRAVNDPDSEGRIRAIEYLADGWRGDPNIVPLLRSIVVADEAADVRQAAIWALTRGWKTDPSVERFLVERTAGREILAVTQGAARLIPGLNS